MGTVAHVRVTHGRLKGARIAVDSRLALPMASAETSNHGLPVRPTRLVEQAGVRALAHLFPAAGGKVASIGYAMDCGKVLLPRLTTS